LHHLSKWHGLTEIAKQGVLSLRIRLVLLYFGTEITSAPVGENGAISAAFDLNLD